MKSIVNLPVEDIFAGIEDVDPRSVWGVETSSTTSAPPAATGRSRADIEVHLSTNPSHLEAVDAVVMGRTRARQERWAPAAGSDSPGDHARDAAFAGQGITSETLNLADLPHYSVGGPSASSSTTSLDSPPSRRRCTAHDLPPRRPSASPCPSST